MEHETGSGWTRSPAQVSDGANAGDEVGIPAEAETPARAHGGDEDRDESAMSATGEASAADHHPAPAEAADRGGDSRGPATPATGEPRVDAALRLLEQLPGLPVSDHPQLFEQVHARLSEVLGELDSGPGPDLASR